MGLYNPDDIDNRLNALRTEQGIPDPMVANSTFSEGSLSVPQYARLEQRSAENNNWVVSLIHNGIGDWSKNDPEYNPWEHIKDTKYSAYPEYFINTDNQDELDYAMRQVDEKEEYEQLAARAPHTSFWSGMAWGMIDPLLAIPGVGAVKIARAGKTISRLNSAIQTGALTSAALSVSEGVLQSSQPDRTASQSAAVIAAGGVVGAAFGGLVAHSMAPEAMAAAMKPTAILEPTKAAIAQNQDEAIKAVSQVLNITDNSVATDFNAAKANISDDNYIPLADRIDDGNMAGHVSAFARRWADANPYTKIRTVAEEKATMLNSKNSLPTYYHGYFVPGEEGYMPLPKYNDAVLGSGYWTSLEEETAKQFGKTVEKIQGEYKILDLNNIKEDEIKSAYAAAEAAAKSFYTEKASVLDTTRPFSNKVLAARKTFLDLVKKEGYEGVSRKIDSPSNLQIHNKSEIMFFDKPQNKSKIANEDKATMQAAKEQEALEEELAKVLEPQGGDLANLESDTQGIGAGHVTYDARIKGLPDFAVKAIAIPHVVNPSIEGMASASATVRDLTTRLGYTHYPLKNSLGEQITAPISLESRMQQDMLQALDFNKMLDQSYLTHIQIDPSAIGGTIRGAIKSSIKGTLKKKDFETFVMDAMNAGDRHAIPEVEQAAKSSRNLVNQRYKDLQEIGLIDKDRAPFPNWFKVVYDINKIIANRMDFEEALTRRFLNSQKAEVVFERNGKELIEDAIYNPSTKSVNWEPRNGDTIKEVRTKGPISVEDARLAASDSVDNILQMGDKNLALGDIDRLSFTRGTDSGKPRKIVMTEDDYQALKPWLVQNFRDIMHHYLAGSSRAINFKKMLDELGVSNINDLRIRARDEFKAKMYKVQNIKEKPKEEIKKLPKEERSKYLPKETKDKMIAKLNKQAISAENLLNDLLKIGLGQFKKRTSADSFWRMSNQYNAARLYGGILISSLGDPASTLIKNFLPKAIWNGWLSELKQVVTGTRKLKEQDYRNALTAIQNEMDDLTRFLINPDMGNYTKSKAEQFATAAGDLQMRASGMILWNNFWQRASHNLAETNILKHVTTNSEKGLAYLKELGIDSSMGKRILAMQKKYGEDIRGTHISNSHRWSDREAAARFNNAIRTEVHKSPLITEMLDIPRFFQRSEMRKAMVLGKGFSFGAITKLTLSAAARHDALALQGMVALISAGMLVKALKDKIANRDSDYSLDEWIGLGLDQSGALGMLADPMFQSLKSIKSKRDWGNNAWTVEPIDYILGPNASIINPAYNAIIEKFAGKPIDKKTEYQLKALIPFNNLWYLNLKRKKQ